MAKSRLPAPIAAAVLLLLPVLYVGSYLALVRPGEYAMLTVSDESGDRYYFNGYRHFGYGTWPGTTKVAPAIFWPLEQIDRRLRSGAWDSSSLQLGTRTGVPLPTLNPADPTAP